MSLHKQNTNGCEEFSKSAAVREVHRAKMKTFLPVLTLKVNVRVKLRLGFRLGFELGLD